MLNFVNDWKVLVDFLIVITDKNINLNKRVSQFKIGVQKKSSLSDRSSLLIKIHFFTLFLSIESKASKIKPLISLLFCESPLNKTSKNISATFRSPWFNLLNRISAFKVHPLFNFGAIPIDFKTKEIYDLVASGEALYNKVSSSIDEVKNEVQPVIDLLTSGNFTLDS